MKLPSVLASLFWTLLLLYIPLDLALVITYPIELTHKQPYLQVYVHTISTLIPGMLVLVSRAPLGVDYWGSAVALLALNAFFIWLAYAPAVNQTPWLFQGL